MSATHKKIKAFAFRFVSETHIMVAEMLHEHGIEIIYWGGLKEGGERIKQNQKVFMNTIFHDTFDATRGFPPEGIDADFDPPSRDLLASLLHCESQVLTMMNSVDVRNNISVIQRKHIYHEYVRYWYGVLSRLKPDVIFFGDIPHLAYQYVVYCLARHLKIKTIMYRTLSGIKGRMLFTESIEEYGELEEELKKISLSEISPQSLSDEIKKYYYTQVNRDDEKSSPFYMGEDFLKKRRRAAYQFPTFGKIIQNIKRGSIFKTTFAYFKLVISRRRTVDLVGFSYLNIFMWWWQLRWNKMKDAFRKDYENYKVLPDFSKKYVYVPLHNQPECSTSAMGGVFVDQILMVCILASAVPAGWKVYVKENPIQWIAPRTQNGRFKGYYEALANIKNVELVPASASTYELVKHSQAVASVTSTACFEAVLRGKPALVFGNIWYIYCDGMFRVFDTHSCKEAFKAITSGYVPQKEKVLRFLKALDNVSIRGYPNTRYKKGFGMTMSDEENARNIAGGFLKAVLGDAHTPG